MNCPKCGGVTSFQNTHCEKCNADLTQYRKIWSVSNQFYNDGLEKAKVRDLSGAIVSLKNSLQANKRNIASRNLLGLIYYEMGETVMALGEWVLSKNYQEEDNIADDYMRRVQENPSKLHNTNQIIKKYNYALSQACSGNYDVALLQLKKVVNQQPNYVAAHQLLALLYMQAGDNEKAAKSLRKAQKIDINNTRTLHYLAELGLNPSALKLDREITKKQNKVKQIEKSDNPQFFSPEPQLRDGKISKWSFLYLLIGIVIGLLAVIFLVLPTRESAIADKYNKEAVKMAEEQTNMTSQMQTMEEDKKNLQKKIDSLEAELQKVKDEAVDEAAYNKFFKAVTQYIQGEKEMAAEALVKMDISKFESKAAKELYDAIAADSFADMSVTTYKEGYSKFLRRDYAGAVDLFLLALKYDETNTDSMYYLGRSYQMLGQDSKAKKYYKKIINDYATSARVGEATRRMEEFTEE